MRFWVEKNPGKYMHKLNKQQRERLRYLGNVSEVFIEQKVMEKALEKDEKFGGKCDRTKLKNDENLEEKRTEMRPF